MAEVANVKYGYIAGGAAGNHTVTGIAVGDRLIKVLALGSASDVLTPVDLTSEFSITDDDTINNTGGTSTADGAVLVIYEKYESGRYGVRDQPGRAPY